MKNIVIIAAVALLTNSVFAGVVIEVEVTGQVVFNGIGDPPLGNVNGGESVVMSFLVNSSDFVDGVPGDTRGYVIDQSSFLLSFGGGVSVGLLNPFPGGQTPYFGIVDGFPVSDGFFVSISTNSPGGVPLEQEPFNANLSLGYTGDTLNSLDILDAVGTYDFDGLTSFGFNLWANFPDNVAMEMDFVQMTITVIPAPATLALFVVPIAFGPRRRRLI